MSEKFIRDITKTIYPLLYNDFKSKDSNSEDAVLFTVEDLTENKFNDAIEFMVKNCPFTDDFMKSFNTKNADGSEKHPRIFFREIFDRKLSLVCTKPGSREIIAVNTLIVKSRGIDDEISKTDDSELFSNYDVNYFLQCVGLVIHPEFRDRHDFILELIKGQMIFLPGLEGVSLMSTCIPKSANFGEINLEKLKQDFPNFHLEQKSTDISIEIIAKRN